MPGVFPRVPFLEMTEQDWDHVLDVNLKGSCFCAQYVAKAMVSAGRRGGIIKIASGAALRARAARLVRTGCSLRATQLRVAEGAGFEPARQLITVYTLSRHAPSTARPPLRVLVRDCFRGAPRRN